MEHTMEHAEEKLLYEEVLRRRSVRKYDDEPLTQEELAAAEQALASFAPLYPDVPLYHRIAQRVRGSFHVEAPQYMIINGRGRERELENAGFLFEQFGLWLSSRGLGSVWLGASKDAQNPREGDILAMAFGRPAAGETVYREAGQFARKPIASITNAPDDVRLEAVRLAPSGLNLQPWYFEKQDGRVLVYQAKLKPPVSLLYKLADLDMGIALCHYALACAQDGAPFSFERTRSLPEKKGFVPFGVITE